MDANSSYLLQPRRTDTRVTRTGCGGIQGERKPAPPKRRGISGMGASKGVERGGELPLRPQTVLFEVIRVCNSDRF